MTHKNNILSLKILAFSTVVFIFSNGRLAAAPASIDQKNLLPEQKHENVSAVEDLMREHGLLCRILLIYDKESKDAEAGKAPSYGVLFKAANIIKDFIENYHEKLEEDYIFPRFEKTGQFADLVKVLRLQHQAGRALTDTILEISKPEEIDKKSKLEKLCTALHSFSIMYRPHKAREDTVLFPALHETVSQKEYEAMSEQFEARERQLFGKDGFENMVRITGELEKQVALYDLSEFTAKIEK